MGSNLGVQTIADDSECIICEEFGDIADIPLLDLEECIMYRGILSYSGFEFQDHKWYAVHEDDRIRDAELLHTLDLELVDNFEYVVLGIPEIKEVNP